MKNEPVRLTSTDIKQLALSQTLLDAFALEDSQELEDYLRDGFCAKFPHYMTDCPGYAGEVVVVLTGVLSALVLTRSSDGSFVLAE